MGAIDEAVARWPGRLEGEPALRHLLHHVGERLASRGDPRKWQRGARDSSRVGGLGFPRTFAPSDAVGPSVDVARGGGGPDSPGERPVWRVVLRRRMVGPAAIEDVVVRVRRFVHETEATRRGRAALVWCYLRGTATQKSGVTFGDALRPLVGRIDQLLLADLLRSRPTPLTGDDHGADPQSQEGEGRAPLVCGLATLIGAPFVGKDAPQPRALGLGAKAWVSGVEALCARTDTSSSAMGRAPLRAQSVDEHAQCAIETLTDRVLESRLSPRAVEESTGGAESCRHSRTPVAEAVRSAVAQLLGEGDTDAVTYGLHIAAASLGTALVFKNTSPNGEWPDGAVVLAPAVGGLVDVGPRGASGGGVGPMLGDRLEVSSTTSGEDDGGGGGGTSRPPSGGDSALGFERPRARLGDTVSRSAHPNGTGALSMLSPVPSRRDDADEGAVRRGGRWSGVEEGSPTDPGDLGAATDCEPWSAGPGRRGFAVGELVLAIPVDGAVGCYMPAIVIAPSVAVGVDDARVRVEWVSATTAGSYDGGGNLASAETGPSLQCANDRLNCLVESSCIVSADDAEGVGRVFDELVDAVDMSAAADMLRDVQTCARRLWRRGWAPLLSPGGSVDATAGNCGGAPRRAGGGRITPIGPPPGPTGVNPSGAPDDGVDGFALPTQTPHHDYDDDDVAGATAVASAHTPAPAPDDTPVTADTAPTSAAAAATTIGPTGDIGDRAARGVAGSVGFESRPRVAQEHTSHHRGVGFPPAESPAPPPPRVDRTADLQFAPPIGGPRLRPRAAGAPLEEDTPRFFSIDGSQLTGACHNKRHHVEAVAGGNFDGVCWHLGTEKRWRLTQVAARDLVPSSEAEVWHARDAERNEWRARCRPEAARRPDVAAVCDIALWDACIDKNGHVAIRVPPLLFPTAPRNGADAVVLAFAPRTTSGSATANPTRTKLQYTEVVTLKGVGFLQPLDTVGADEKATSHLSGIRAAIADATADLVGYIHDQTGAEASFLGSIRPDSLPALFRRIGTELPALRSTVATFVAENAPEQAEHVDYATLTMLGRCVEAADCAARLAAGRRVAERARRAGAMASREFVDGGDDSDDIDTDADADEGGDPSPNGRANSKRAADAGGRTHERLGRRGDRLRVMLIGEHRRDRGLGYGDFYCVSNHPDMLGAADARFALEGDLRCLRPGPLRGGFDLFTGTGLSDLAFQVGSGGIAMPVRVDNDASKLATNGRLCAIPASRTRAKSWKAARPTGAAKCSTTLHVLDVHNVHEVARAFVVATRGAARPEVSTMAPPCRPYSSSSQYMNRDQPFSDKKPHIASTTRVVLETSRQAACTLDGHRCCVLVGSLVAIGECGARRAGSTNYWHVDVPYLLAAGRSVLALEINSSDVPATSGHVPSSAKRPRCVVVDMQAFAFAIDGRTEVDLLCEFRDVARAKIRAARQMPPTTLRTLLKARKFTTKKEDGRHWFLHRDTWYDSIRFGPRKAGQKEVYGLDCTVKGLRRSCGTPLNSARGAAEATAAGDFGGTSVCEVDTRIVMCLAGIPHHIKECDLGFEGASTNQEADAIAEVAGPNLIAFLGEVYKETIGEFVEAHREQVDVATRTASDGRKPQHLGVHGTSARRDGSYAEHTEYASTGTHPEEVRTRYVETKKRRSSLAIDSGAGQGWPTHPVPTPELRQRANEAMFDLEARIRRRSRSRPDIPLAEQRKRALDVESKAR